MGNDPIAIKYNSSLYRNICIDSCTSSLELGLACLLSTVKLAQHQNARTLFQRSDFLQEIACFAQSGLCVRMKEWTNLSASCGCRRIGTGLCNAGALRFVPWGNASDCVITGQDFDLAGI